MCVDFDWTKIVYRARKLGGWSKGMLLLVAISSIAFATYALRPIIDRNHRHYVLRNSTLMETINSATKLNLNEMNDVIISLLSFVVLIFQIIHVVLGTFYYNLYELVGMLVTQFLITCIVLLPLIRDLSIHFHWSVDDYFTLVICGIVAICQIAYVAFAFPLYREFSWRFYRMFGSDTTYRTRVRNYMKFVVLLRVDLVMWITIAITSHHFVNDIYPWEFGIDGLALIASLAFVIVGYFGHKKEIYPLMVSFWGLALVGPVYLCHVYRNLHAEVPFLLKLFSGHHVWKLDNALLVAFLVVGVSLIAVRVTLLVFSVLVSRDFGKTGMQVKEYRGLVNGENQYADVEYEGIDVENDGSDSDEGRPRNKLSVDLSFEDLIRNTHRYTATPSSNELPEISRY
jgi:hypothetical protein